MVRGAGGCVRCVRSEGNLPLNLPPVHSWSRPRPCPSLLLLQMRVQFGCHWSRCVSRCDKRRIWPQAFDVCAVVDKMLARKQKVRGPPFLMFQSQSQSLPPGSHQQSYRVDARENARSLVLLKQCLSALKHCLCLKNIDKVLGEVTSTTTTEAGGGSSHWRDCHVDDALSPSLLIHLCVGGGQTDSLVGG